MTSLDIINQDGTLVVSSTTIADGAGTEHASVLALVDRHLADFEEFGRVRFEIEPFLTAGGAQSRRVALLNEQQTTLLMAFQRNTDQVVAFKKALVKAFFDMARQLAAQREPQWNLPQNFAEALRELASTVEARDALAAQVTRDAPLVAREEVFRDARSLRTVQDLANDFRTFALGRFPGVKVLQSDVFDHAGRLGLLIRGNTLRHNQPTSRAIQAGWVRPHRTDIETTSHGTKTTTSTRLTATGEARLWDGMFAWINDRGTLHIPTRAELDAQSRNADRIAQLRAV